MLGLLLTTCTAKVIEITTENLPQDALDGIEFAVINFYDDSESSKAFLEIFKITSLMFKTNEVVRTRSVAFAQVDVKTYPELSLA